MKMINDMTFSYSMITELERDIFKVKEKIKEGQHLCRLHKSVTTFSFCCPNNNRISE